MRDLERVAEALNEALCQRAPEMFSSAWIAKHLPGCYRFIRKHVRSEAGGIDWDTLTYALDPKYQRLWKPRAKRRSRPSRSRREINLVLGKYRNKLYVFLTPVDAEDLRIRDTIAIALVRIAQTGNFLARDEVIALVRYTVDIWLDDYAHMSRWKGHEDEIREHIKGCIRRYRYSGSFLRYVYRTLECAGRGIRPTLSLLLR